jgi:hypothetical protein
MSRAKKRSFREFIPMGLFDAPASQQPAADTQPAKTIGWLGWAMEDPDAKPTGMAEQKHRGETEERDIPGQLDEGHSDAPRGGGRFATARDGSKSFMSAKGKVTSRHLMMEEREKVMEETAKEIENTRRLTARASARATTRKASLHPLVTSRPPQQRWKKRADDWKHDGQQHLTIDHLWNEAAKTDLGRPPKPFAQVQSRVQGGALSEKERAYQLETQLLNRERKRLQAVKARKKEAEAVKKHEENTKRLEWYHQQRERAAAPLKPEEREMAKQRLYASPRKQKKGLVYA